ncbi:MAG: hypothetical protein HKL96_03280 [Phycisphaerales bacterium]|nr:hypothetical protein [Phycisphaerales bacterium]
MPDRHDHQLAANGLWRFPLLVAAIITMALGIWGGLIRLGWAWPAPTEAVVDHGSLMIGGFLGTLLGMERAVALGWGWCYVGPTASAAGAILLITGFPPLLGGSLILAASIVMVLDFVFIIRRQAAIFTLVMAGGAVAWAIGNILWLTGTSIYEMVLWWMGFLVLTIVGERLELSRLLPQSKRKRRTFLGAAGLFALGMLTTLAYPGLGECVAGMGLLTLAAWLFVYDVARHTVRQHGLPRFIAVCLLTGYLWLGIGGILAVIYAVVLPILHGHAWMRTSLGPGFAYDAFLHTVFLGFVFGMIFGHAPIIFPAVLGVRMQFSRRFYLHLVLLEGSVAWRVVGDISGVWSVRQWAGLLNGVTILLFLVNTVASVRRKATVPAGGPVRSTP